MNYVNRPQISSDARSTATITIRHSNIFTFSNFSFIFLFHNLRAMGAINNILNTVTLKLLSRSGSRRATAVFSIFVSSVLWTISEKNGSRESLQRKMILLVCVNIFRAIVCTQWQLGYCSSPRQVNGWKPPGRSICIQCAGIEIKSEFLRESLIFFLFWDCRMALPHSEKQGLLVREDKIP